MLIDSSANVNTVFLFVEQRLMKKETSVYFINESYGKEIISL